MSNARTTSPSARTWNEGLGTTGVHPHIAWLIAAGNRYWPHAGDAVASLARSAAPPDPTGRYVEIELPSWAADLGVGQPASLLVDAAAVDQGSGPAFERCEWFDAAFLYLSGSLERQHESAHGPVHSYAFRLPISDRAHERAWVNRIFMLLRRMAARAHQKSEQELFGPLPDAVFDLTHDLDAVRKTPEIRLKQSAFRLFNAARALRQASLSRAMRHLAESAQFLVGFHDLWMLPRLIEIEERAGMRSTLHVYGGGSGRRRTISHMLMDPAYSVAQPDLRDALQALHAGGWTIGLHQSYDSWHDANAMRRERETIEHAIDAAVIRCRQHWLRFGWKQTWAAQAEAGLTLDTTLGFNDRCGFRVGAALAYAPWDPARLTGMNHSVLPMILMDSHVYDYAPLSETERRETMTRLVDEVVAVRGEASFNWHCHTLSEAYGWESGYLELLDIIAARHGSGR